MNDHQDLCVLFHSGELAGRERAEFELHLRSCPACLGLLAALEAGSRAAASAALPLPARARVAALGRSRAAARPFGPATLVLAAAALLVALQLRAPRRADVPTWRELEAESSRLASDLAALSDSVHRGSDAELDAELTELEERTHDLARDASRGGRLL